MKAGTLIICSASLGLFLTQACKPSQSGAQNSKVAAADGSPAAVQYELALGKGDQIVRAGNAAPWRKVAVSQSMGSAVFSWANGQTVWIFHDTSSGNTPRCLIQAAWTKEKLESSAGAAASPGVLKGKLWNCQNATTGDLEFALSPYSAARSDQSNPIYTLTTFLVGLPDLQLFWETDETQTPLKGRVVVRTDSYSDSERDVLLSFERSATAGQYRIEVVNAARQSYAPRVQGHESEMADLGEFLIWSAVNASRLLTGP